MGHYRLSDSMPSAIILAKNPRSGSLDELKTYQENQIFLNNKDEFQIRLFNPLSEKIGVSIELNGKLPSGLLILNPGQDIIVDRFIDDKKKMIFETYQYDASNPSAEKAVAKNGVINLRFFKEYTPPIYNAYNYGTLHISGGTFTGGYATLTNTNGMGSCTTQGLTNINSTFTSNSSNNFNSPGVYCCDSDLSFVDDFKDYVAENIEDSIDYSDYVKQSSGSKSRGIMKGKQMSKDFKKETGRVEKGQASNQNFDQVNAQFETYPFYVVSYQLKPNSEKNTLLTEVREYCTSCGFRLRNKNWSYCPKCGEKL